MVRRLVITADIQWVKLITSGPLTPGKKYLAAPEKPASRGEHRPTDDQVVIVEQPGVHLHRHVLAHQAALMAAISSAPSTPIRRTPTASRD
jgi:hypothetical protein